MKSNRHSEGSVLGNNIRVFVIHPVISVLLLLLTLAIVGVFSAVSDEAGTVSLGLTVATGIAAYIFAGYAFLKPLPKRNLLSVSFHAIVFMAFAGIGIASTLLGPIPLVTPIVEAVAVALSVAGCLLIITASFIQELLMGSNNPQMLAGGLSLYLPLFFASIMPSLFMYIGLRLRIRKESRKPTLVDTLHPDECVHYSTLSSKVTGGFFNLRSEDS